MDAHFDTIIVGGGAAGCVLANRLSARSSHRVLLCEAGEDTPVGAVPDVILDSFPGPAFLNPRFIWNQLQVTTEAIPHNRPDVKPRQRTYEQGRVLGGGSSINGQLLNRGAPHDYDEWEARGATGWNWNSVLPYFRKVERDMDFAGPLHGTDGRIPVTRIFPDLWPEHAKGMSAALTRHGLPYIADQNGEFQDGHYPLAISNYLDRRVSAAIGYLDPATRQRPNLTVLTSSPVSRLVMEGARCVGVDVMTGQGARSFRAGEVIVSSGALHSPAHLLRAGIGPAAHLRALGIEVVADRPGVGQGLMDHPSVAIAAFIKPHARINGRMRRHLMIGVRWSSGLEGAAQGDMAATISTKSAWHAVGEQIATFNMWVNQTFSSAGQVRLQSADWRAEPEVDFNLLSDHRDLERLASAIRRFAPLFAWPEVRAVVSDPFPASYSDKVREIGAITTKNKILTNVLAKLLDGPASLRTKLINSLIVEGAPLDVLTRDDAALEAFIRHAAVGVWHCSCSCRMGSLDDPMAVTAPDGRVYGVEGLRVVDASIFPRVPSANTNFPTLMAAEKIADAILA
jgi:5-(hydroxymethyl)furfural/furfural oxidase